jgi:hypothetical protein
VEVRITLEGERKGHIESQEGAGWSESKIKLIGRKKQVRRKEGSGWGMKDEVGRKKKSN